jgi:hypothetical protein
MKLTYGARITGDFQDYKTSVLEDIKVSKHPVGRQGK